MSVEIRFRALAAADLPLVHRWLNAAHVRDAYAHGRATTPEQVADEYDPERLRAGGTQPWIVLLDGVPAGYVQTYRILDHPAYAAATGIDDESWGLDLFLGEPGLVGRGIGPEVIRGFATAVVFASTPACSIVADPPSRNRRSWRAFEKAGFRLWRTVTPTDEGSGDRLMRLDRAR